MPIYGYKCRECNYEFEEFQKMSDEPLSECPKCQGEVKRLISSGVGVVFKGKGFYSTEYKDTPPAPPACEGCCGLGGSCDLGG